jgi:hypothetical protein
MIDRNGAPVDESTAAEIVKWLQDYRGFSDSWMFRAKCRRCHDVAHLKSRGRTAQEWAFIVDRVGWITPFGFREDQKTQIKKHLAANLAVEPPLLGSPGRVALDHRLELQAACNPCHSIALILEEGAMDEPEEMVKRMSEKNPTLVPPDKVENFAEWLLELPRDEAKFWSVLPHDILLDQVDEDFLKTLMELEASLMELEASL